MFTNIFLRRTVNSFSKLCPCNSVIVHYMSQPCILFLFQISLFYIKSLYFLPLSSYNCPSVYGCTCSLIFMIKNEETRLNPYIVQNIFIFDNVYIFCIPRKSLWNKLSILVRCLLFHVKLGEQRIEVFLELTQGFHNIFLHKLETFRITDLLESH